MSKEALKLALEAFGTLMIERGSIYDKAITAIKEALAQPEQEPVADQLSMTVRIWRDKNGDQNAEFRKWHTLPDGEHTFYTTPPQRTWVGLDEEDDIDWEEGGSLRDLVEAVEAKLKEKNT